MRHTSYQPGGTNDILVVKTGNPFQLTQRVNTIKLAKDGNDPRGNLVFLMYWAIISGVKTSNLHGPK